MRTDFFTYSDCVILCNGAFPTHPVPLRILSEARTIICCDGAVEKLLAFGLEPTVIVGDLDSIDKSILERYTGRTYYVSEQETNDLTKSVQWAKANGHRQVTILGATGLREDHTLGNISLLADYQQELDAVRMVTDTGVFTPITNTTEFPSYKGQQVSIFSLNPTVHISGANLQYPLPSTLRSWWCGTLNESLADTFTITVQHSPVIVFREY